jgi:small multidrug resistance pump/quaternary ammonium compound-resistance protein SugE
MLLLMSFSSALSFTVGGIFMQLSEGLSKPLPSLLVYVMFGLGASLQTLATRQSGMGLTYILVVGLEALLAVVFSIVFFREGYSMTKLLGVFLVAMGVVFLRSSAP